MKLWIDENDQRCCDRSTAVELGGQKQGRRRRIHGEHTGESAIL